MVFDERMKTAEDVWLLFVIVSELGCSGRKSCSSSAMGKGAVFEGGSTREVPGVG